MLAALNILALVLSCVAAHLAPAATLIGAYVLLGPLHYLTEISWLHDRRYFVARPMFLVVGTAAGVVGGLAMAGVGGVVAIAPAGACIAAGIGARRTAILLSGLGAGVVATVGLLAGWWWVLALVLLVPTLIHVFAMTAMFVVAGAVRARKASEWTVVAALAACAISFVLVPSVDVSGGMMLDRAHETFGTMFSALGVRNVEAASALLGFTAFAYAYHYLNWFLKARTIGWATMYVRRRVLLGSVWSVIAIAYVIDVRLGLLVSLPLSFGHVLLEMPLNVSVARRLFGTSFGGSSSRPTTAAPGGG
jgi:hypothetical protein